MADNEKETNFAVYMSPYPANCRLKVEGVIVTGHPLSPRQPHLLLNAYKDPPEEVYLLRNYGRAYYIENNDMIALCVRPAASSENDELEESEYC